MIFMQNEMFEKNAILKLSFDFSLLVIEYTEKLEGLKKFTLAKQLFKSGTSIGANVEEAQAGQSKLDFISKNAIALKEARETIYWLRLLAASKIVPSKRLSELQVEADELARIIGAIIVSAKRGKKL